MNGASRGDHWRGAASTLILEAHIKFICLLDHDVSEN
jgi:hypothetical protein